MLRRPPGVPHCATKTGTVSQPAAVSLTQASEAGTVYRPDETAAIAEVCRGHGLGLHVDGARFANALAMLGCTPAEASWRAGVDVLSFGATKNGALAAEAVLFFRPDDAAGFRYRRKRAGHLVSKMRFVSAQLDAYLDNGLWLANAAHANAMAARLADGLRGIAAARFNHPVEANELFVSMPPAIREGLAADGFAFYPWAAGGPDCVRLVTAFDTPATAVDAFIASARRHAGGGAGPAVGGPYRTVRCQLPQIFSDCQRVRDPHVVMDQHRNPPGGRDRRQLCLAVGTREAQRLGGEIEPGQLACQPAPHRPGARPFSADDQVHG